MENRGEKLEYIKRFISNVKEYYSPHTTLGRVRALAIIIEAEIIVLDEIFGVPMEEIASLYRIAKEYHK